MSSKTLQVAAFYSFIHLDEGILSILLEELSITGKKYQLTGTILLASEGVNGTICGQKAGVAQILKVISKALAEETLQVKYSVVKNPAFRRFKVRRKAEIVTMGVNSVNPLKSVGVYVEPHNWNDYLTDPETLIIDTRNNYEIGIGSFQGSLNPHTDSFREFPKWVRDYLRPLVKKLKPKRIAMFCTGGIRCEKATSYLCQEGFEGVHHLHGGILRYLDEVPQEKSLWRGECFVFDQRVALNHSLLPGEHLLCYACGMPLNKQDRKSNDYVRGVQCHHCIDLFDDDDRLRFAERQKQFDENSDYLNLKN